MLCYLKRDGESFSKHKQGGARDCFPEGLSPCPHFPPTSAQALFARLLLQEPGSHLIHMTSSSTQNLSADRDAGERQILRYLYACFQRAREEVGRGFRGGRLCHPAFWAEVTELSF